MKSKGSVDFLLGVFLEFGAAFCLLFFLPQVPWNWLPEEPAAESSRLAFSSPMGERRISLFPPQAEFARFPLSHPVPNRREAPALLPAVPETVVTVAPAASAPLASHQPAAAPASCYRRELPRKYRY